MSSRFSSVLAQKVYIHRYLDRLPFNELHAIDTKHGHTKRLIRQHHVSQIGYDFGITSTDYLTSGQDYEDVVWLDYCCTASKPFVLKDLRLCQSKWVFCTFSVRACRWKSQIKFIVKGTPYKKAWHYEYNDTSPMILVAYYMDDPPPMLTNPVGASFKYKYKKQWYTRRCKKMLMGPSDEPDELYYEFGDSNEPAAVCIKVVS